MNQLLSIGGTITFCAFMVGCSSPASRNLVPFNVTSDPSGCSVEVNGIQQGKTPTSIRLGFSKRWVGVLNSTTGYDYGLQTYNVTCFPPSYSTEPLTSQTKTITPSMTPTGADLHFDLRLRPVNPTQPIEIIQKGKSEPVNKNEPSQTSDISALKKLQDLKKMKDEGLITDEEYNSKKAKILNEL